MRIIRVLIADDHLVTRRGIVATLSQAKDIVIVGEAENGDVILPMVQQTQPDVLILDLVMPGLSALEIEKHMRTQYPAIPVLILTAHDRDYYLAQSIENGVAGYLSKDIRERDLAAAIRRAAKGQVLITGGQRARALSWQMEVEERWKQLTVREQEVLACVCAGQSTEQVADDLGISTHTVETHIGNIMRKLDIPSRTVLVSWVWKNSLTIALTLSGKNQ